MATNTFITTPSPPENIHQPDIIDHDWANHTFKLKDKTVLLMWRNALSKRYTRQNSGPITVRWEDRNDKEKTLSIPLTISVKPPELVKTFCQIFYQDFHCLTIHLYFFKKKGPWMCRLLPYPGSVKSKMGSLRI